MSCKNCVTKVAQAFKSLPEVEEVQVLLDSGQAVVRMQKAITVTAINEALQSAGHYKALESNKTGNPTIKKEKKQPAILRIFRHKKPCCQ